VNSLGLQQADLLEFVPTPGAAGFQVGNTNALAVSALLSSLEIFEQTSMKDIRKKAISITGFLERLLTAPSENDNKRPYWIITPSSPEQRGTQLSVQLESGILDTVMEGLEEEGIVLDERKPDVIRIAPCPLYNTYTEVWEFVQILNRLCDRIQSAQ
jgi:kynureninase